MVVVSPTLTLFYKVGIDVCTFCSNPAVHDLFSVLLISKWRVRPSFGYESVLILTLVRHFCSLETNPRKITHYVLTYYIWFFVIYLLFRFDI